MARIPDIAAEQLRRLTPSEAQPNQGEKPGWFDRMFTRSPRRERNYNIAPEDPTDKKWEAIRDLLKQYNTSDYEQLPADVQENPVVGLPGSAHYGEKALIWNGVTGTMQTPAEYLDFKRLAAGPIYNNKSYDPQGEHQLQSFNTPRKNGPEVYERTPAGLGGLEPEQMGDADLVSSRKEDQVYKTRIMRLMGL